jgi:hypothetical protein
MKPMNGKELKDLVATIPDEAQMLIAGPDSGGYDWTYHYKAIVRVPTRIGHYIFEGVTSDSDDRDSEAVDD